MNELRLFNIMNNYWCDNSSSVVSIKTMYVHGDTNLYNAITDLGPHINSLYA